MKKLLAGLFVFVIATPLLAEETGRGLKVYSDVENPICEGYIAPVANADYGEDLIVGSCIPHGRYRTLYPRALKGKCMVNMKFVFEDGYVEIVKDFDICNEIDYYFSGG
jgi:hypothetical protein